MSVRFASALAMATAWTMVASAQEAAAPAEAAPAEVAPVEPTAEPAPEPVPVSEPAAAPVEKPAAPAMESEVIADPELEGVAPVLPPVAAPPPAEPNGEARAAFRSRVGMDLAHESPREEVWEATQVGLVELRVRRSERLRFAAGLRLRHVLAARESDTPDADAARHTLDVAPTAGYADATIADGLHARLGYQLVKLGRFDLFSAIDVLSVYDVRSGPVTMAEAADVAQPAARLDWDATSALALRVIYLPFFQPHVVSVFDTDYALARPDQASFEALVDDAAGVDMTLDADDIERILREGLSRSGRDRFAQGAFAALAPDPDFSDPQAAVSLSLHGPAGEAALTLATALERLPALAPSAALLAAVEDPSTANQEALRREPRPVRVEHGRFFVVAIDGATEAGPMQLGAELSYQHDRVYLGVAPGALAEPEPVGVVQLGLRAEHASGGPWLVGVEGFGSYALDVPADPAARWLFVQGERARWGAAALVGFSPGRGAFTLEVGGGVVNGPSLAVLPRIEWRFVEGMFAELGLVVVEGPARGGFGDPRAALGGLYDDADLAFVGVGWRP